MGLTFHAGHAWSLILKVQKLERLYIARPKGYDFIDIMRAFLRFTTSKAFHVYLKDLVDVWRS